MRQLPTDANCYTNYKATSSKSNNPGVCATASGNGEGNFQQMQTVTRIIKPIPPNQTILVTATQLPDIPLARQAALHFAASAIVQPPIASPKASIFITGSFPTNMNTFRIFSFSRLSA